MKIRFDTISGSRPGTYFQSLVEVLERHAPEHEYIVDLKHNNRFDIYHSFSRSFPIYVHFTDIRCVMTISNLNFLRHPQMYTLFERLVHIRLYKYACRRADCLITMNRKAKEELIEQLDIDERKIKVMMPLAVHLPSVGRGEQDLAMIRKKYALPENFVLLVGAIESRQNLMHLIEAIIDIKSDINLVVCGRKTHYSDSVLRYARAVGGASEIEFIYEADLADISAILRMARAFVCIPDAGAEVSVMPLVEALRVGVPMILSDTPLYREAAADAALYIPRGDQRRLLTALRCVLYDDEFRCELIARGQVRAELFSEYAVAQRLIDIYAAL